MGEYLNEREFSTLDIVKALDIPRERLRDWMDRKFITPTTIADGQGTKAVFTLQDVYSVALFQCLIRHGFNRKAASMFVGDFMKQPAQKDAAYVILRSSIGGRGTARRSIAAISADECRINFGMGTLAAIQHSVTMPRFGDLDETEQDWQMIHIVNYTALRKEVDAAIAKVDDATTKQ